MPSQHEMLSWLTVTVVDKAHLFPGRLWCIIYRHITLTFPRVQDGSFRLGSHVCVCSHRRWWEFSWWSACWPPALCRGWLHIAHLHAGSSAMEGILALTVRLHVMHIMCCGLFTHMCLSFFAVCSGSSIRQKESCVHWLGSRCPSRTGETGGSWGRVWYCVTSVNQLRGRNCLEKTLIYRPVTSVLGDPITSRQPRHITFLLEGQRAAHTVVMCR